MSRENVEIVKAAIAEWNAGDMDGLREVFDPDVIVRLPEGWPEPGPFVGREAVMNQWSGIARSGTLTHWNRSATSSTRATESP